MVPVMNADIVLGSASPRRADLLRQMGLSFDVVAGDVEERRLANETPVVYCERIALAKARHVANRCRARLIIAADTVVVLRDEILGKPNDEASAREMLSRLSGHTHRVVTGVSVLERSSGDYELFSVISHVTFRVVQPEEIDRYVRTGEPMDKAGAYGIQERGAVFVRFISGSYSNIMGLPLYETARALTRFGVFVV